jgi:myosin heavy subunit
MNNTNNSNFYKYLSGILGLLLIFSVAYNFKTVNKVENVEKNLASEIIDKNDALQKLNEIKTIYDQALIEKSELSSELEIEREKVNKLIGEIKNKNIDASTLARYESKIKDIENKMRSLILENDALKKANANLTTQVDSIGTELGASKEKNESLNNQNEELNTKIKRASKLVVTNLNAQPFKLKSSGKTVDTDKASRVNAIKVEFTIPRNELANSGEKLYFIQIIDPKNNVIGDKKEINFDNKLLVYSFPSKVNYKNETIKISEIIKGEDFVKGRYSVNIFDNGTQVSTEYFELK